MKFSEVKLSEVMQRFEYADAAADAWLWMHYVFTALRLCEIRFKIEMFVKKADKKCEIKFKKTHKAKEKKCDQIDPSIDPLLYTRT